VVRRRYGLLDGRQAKLADIAAVWGITAERVRQIERHAISKLRADSEAA
jgi:DNA-directed RNA polymerase sigma subunit (sigma70/sigma32)